MARISFEDLTKIKERELSRMVLSADHYRAKITVHMGTCGIAAGARDVLSALLAEIEAKDIKEVTVVTSGCAGLCSSEPMTTVEMVGQAPVKYVNLDAEKILRILNEHALGGKIVEEYSLSTGSEREG